MNFVVICLHCLDMRDFHSMLRHTPILNRLRTTSVLLPMGRAQAHHHCDSLVAETTGVWTARMSDSKFTETGYVAPRRFRLAKTLLERLQEAGYEIITKMGVHDDDPDFGTWAVHGGMADAWMHSEPHRLGQFECPAPMSLPEWISRIRRAKRFYAQVVIRTTHRPWAQNEGLCALVGAAPAESPYWPEDARCARKAALEHPDEFAALRRRGLAKADGIVRDILHQTADVPDVTYLIYSNHGEVFDHFRYHTEYRADRRGLIVGTSHGNHPYEVLYANMQMWLIPGWQPRVISGVARSIDIPSTVLELAGVDVEPLDGESMVPYFAAGRFPYRERHAESYSGDGCLSMVRTDRLKLVSTGQVDRGPENTPQGLTAMHRLAVFDLEADPYEYVNLIDYEQGREMLAWAVGRHHALSTAPAPD